MDRRVLFASLILLAGGATGVSVALFAFVGVDDATIDAEVVWESDPVAGDDGTGAVVATMDGDPLVLQSTVEDETRTIRATAVGGDVEWRTAVGEGGGTGGSGTDGTDESTGADPPATSGLVTGELDGAEAVAFTTETGALVVLDPTDGTERVTVDLGGPGGLRPAIGDLDGDGDGEVAAVTTDGRVRAVDASGETVFETDLDAPVERRPLAVDFGAAGGSGDEAGDDGDEIDRGLAVATAADGDHSISLLDADGEAQWTATPSVTPLSWTAADTRSGPVLALGGANGNLETIDVADGGSRYDVGLQDLPVTVGDADPGRVYVGGSGSVWAVDLLDGEVVWKQQYGGDTRVNAPGVADVDGDGSPGPVVVNQNGGALALNQNGEAIARGDVGGAVVYAGPLFADATGDGSAEVLVVADDGRVTALSD
ncbi:PQQ-binding-like beta-propeller repeat protein [Halorubrum kocurii]|uniref:FG-GAP repeat protein n=1 Tax=Halorubrum kocurii JCM 14978 TaxID=1230456 RepID=M0P4A6_9EURY|nr:PQQ-binding-like beta-propeller repeat protein [Halorubrum kocurii]EMA64967.1 FG-GAP repeat protein [Halorubrum kocurii JCM 14978]